MQLTITDVERLKAKARKMTAGRVLAGDRADVGLDLARVNDCQACTIAGYGPLCPEAHAVQHDRLIWTLDGFAQLHDGAGRVTHLSQGESTVLAGGVPYRLVFPQLSLYLLADTRARRSCR
jgi:hypothetical protein